MAYTYLVFALFSLGKLAELPHITTCFIYLAVGKEKVKEI